MPHKYRWFLLLISSYYYGDIYKNVPEDRFYDTMNRIEKGDAKLEYVDEEKLDNLLENAYSELCFDKPE